MFWPLFEYILVKGGEPRKLATVNIYGQPGLKDRRWKNSSVYYGCIHTPDSVANEDDIYFRVHLYQTVPLTEICLCFSTASFLLSTSQKLFMALKSHEWPVKDDINNKNCCAPDTPCVQWQIFSRRRHAGFSQEVNFTRPLNSRFIEYIR